MLVMPVVDDGCREDGVEVACGGFPVVAFNRVCRLGLTSLPLLFAAKIVVRVAKHHASFIVENILDCILLL